MLYGQLQNGQVAHRERELFELRIKHQQVTLWLKLTQALPQIFGDFEEPINDGYAFIRKALIEAL